MFTFIINTLKSLCVPTTGGEMDEKAVPIDNEKMAYENIGGNFTSCE